MTLKSSLFDYVFLVLGATLVTPGPSSRSGPSPREARISTPIIPSSSGTPTVIFNQNKKKVHQADSDSEIDSSLEETEHNITFNEADTEEENSDESSEDTDKLQNDGKGSKGKGKGKGKHTKRQKLSPIQLPQSSFILSEAELRQQRNIQERDRQYEEYERKRLLEQGQQTSDNILGLDLDLD